MASVIVVGVLTHKVIMEFDFLRKFSANIDVWNKKLNIFVDQSKAVLTLITKKLKFRSVQVLVTEEVEIEPRTQKRIECKLQEEVEDGIEIYFEVSDLMNNWPIAIAETVDVAHEGNMTAQIINPTGE